MERKSGAIFLPGALVILWLSLCCLGRQLQDLCICTMEYAPVCCGGKEYGNQCGADCAGAQNCRRGACSSEDPVCPCTREYVPVCCGGEQYANQCLADCAGATNCQKRSCASPKPIADVFVTCAPGSAQARCRGDVCEKSKCPSNPDAKCNINPCGEALFDGMPVDIPICGAYYVADGALVEDCSEFEDVLAGLTCAPGSAQAKCAGDICDKSKCPSNPDAECSINPCADALFDGEPVAIPICGAYYVADGALVEECTDLSGSGVSGLDAKLIAEWTLVKIKQKEGLLPFPGAKATITFTNEGPSQGTLGGNNGCNLYSGDYDVLKEGAIEVGPLISTKIGCVGPNAKLEGLYMQLLGEVDGFKVGTKRLRLFKGKEQVLVFKKDEA